MKFQGDFHIRIAEASDRALIRSLIRRVRINPLNLDWRNFYVAVDERNQIIGCGQIKTHRDGTNELASIAVEQEWRGEGVASSIIRALIENVDTLLWLVCRSDLESFYVQFGFVGVGDVDDLPKAYRRMRSVSKIISRIIPGVGNFAIMLLDPA